MNKEEILGRLNEITSDKNFIYVLSAIVLKDFCGTLSELSSKNVREGLNNNEVKFLMGLWVKNWNKEQETNYDELKVLDEVYSLMEQFHFTFMPDLSEMIKNPSESPFDFFNNGLMFKESMFYSGTGAYDYQYIKWVTEKYKYDEGWLSKSKSINLDKLPDFYNSLKILQQVKLNKLKFNSENTFKDKLLDVFCLSKEDIIAKDKDFTGILENFILDLNQPQNQNFKDVGDFNILAEKPIIELSIGKYFIPMPYDLSEAIYESPFYWMNSDENYRSKAQFNRGEIAEEITYKIIEKIFGPDNTLQNLIIKKSKSTMVTDIDILAVKDDKAIIFQVKSKKLTALSKKGNIDAIQSDFKKAVKDAYEQGLTAAECLKSSNDFQFILKSEPNFKFDFDIKKSFVVTIVLDDYPAITHQTHILLGKEYKEFPVALNIFDLEIVAKYLNTPEKFINYIERRIKYSKYFKADNELGFLGFHLKKGLQKFPNSDMVTLDNTWAQFFDKDYYGEISGVKKIKENLRKKIGRNERCPCGSGIKYKKCHGKNN
jgi:hypothetical protein